LPKFSKSRIGHAPGVRFDKVVLTRGGRPVFDGLTLELGEHRIGIVGNNGSGKSSLLRLINGLLMPEAGSVRVCGYETREHRKQLPELAGFLFQNPEHQILFPTAGEEIAFGLREAGLDALEVSKRVRAILESHSVEDWEHKPVEKLSDGQKQLLCILALMAMEPQILLLDEPFASLDLPTRARLSAEILAAPQQVIIASHDFELLQQFERLIWLDCGKIVADGAPASVLRQYRNAAGQVAEMAAMQ